MTSEWIVNNQSRPWIEIVTERFSAEIARETAPIDWNVTGQPDGTLDKYIILGHNDPQNEPKVRVA